MRITNLASALIIVLGSAGSVWADTVGFAVASIGSSTKVGIYDGDIINFYIPLSSDANGVYGVGGAGTTVDKCSNPGPSPYGACGTGTLQMFLYFSPVVVGPNLLTLDFNDLDLLGKNGSPAANDPWYFLETVSIYDGSTTTVVDDTADPAVVSANKDDQLLQLIVNASSNPFYVQLDFGAKFLSNAPTGNYQNTKETLRATVTTVPEPGSLLLLGVGLSALGLKRGRGRRTDRRPSTN